MKKIFAVMLALAMVLTMTACGKKAKPETKDKIGSAQTGMELYVTTAENGDKTVVDKSGKAAEGYTLDKSGNIVDKAGQVIVAADKVQQLPAEATADKPAEDKAEPDTKTDTKPAEDSKPDTGSSRSSDSGSSSGSDSSNGGSSGSSSGGSPGSSSSDSGSSTPAMPDPTPVHQHSWQAVYRTVEVPVYEDIYFMYCARCGAKWNAYYPQYSCSEDINSHMEAHALSGEGANTYENGIPEHIQTGTTTEEVLDHYICSCGETKQP